MNQVTEGKNTNLRDRNGFVSRTNNAAVQSWNIGTLLIISCFYYKCTLVRDEEHRIQSLVLAAWVFFFFWTKTFSVTFHPPSKWVNDHRNFSSSLSRFMVLNYPDLTSSTFHFMPTSHSSGLCGWFWWQNSSGRTSGGVTTATPQTADPKLFYFVSWRECTELPQLGCSFKI